MSTERASAIDIPHDAPDDLVRCAWAGTDPLMIAYHDHEWGVPTRDERELFERLLLEGFQAGLSWQTILRKRENFRRAFDGFDPVRIANYGEDDVARLLADPGIVRNRLKVRAATTNARAFLRLQDETGPFADYLTAFAPDSGSYRRPTQLSEVPATTPESDALSKDLKRRGFTFVGSTICYAFMQSIGLVDDHLTTCFRAT